MTNPNPKEGVAVFHGGCPGLNENHDLVSARACAGSTPTSSRVAASTVPGPVSSIRRQNGLSLPNSPSKGGLRSTSSICFPPLGIPRTSTWFRSNQGRSEGPSTPFVVRSIRG